VKVALLGLGLIGGSIARALREDPSILRDAIVALQEAEDRDRSSAGRDAIVGQFLDNAPKGVTLEVIEVKGGAGWPSGWTVKADISKAIADLAKRHEALNAIGAGIYENAAYGVQREVVRGYGNLVTVAQVLLSTSRAGYRGERYDLNVTLPSLDVSEDDRNEDRNEEDRNEEDRGEEDRNEVDGVNRGMPPL
jgi:hypothetical protein